MDNSRDGKIRVGKTGFLGPWREVIGYYRKVRILPIVPFGTMGSNPF